MDMSVASEPATGFPRLPALMDLLHIGEELDWVPEHLAESAWHEHVPFAFWLVKALRPRAIVELGTHWGVSYAALCQAVERLGLAARCHAVDSWEGDPHAGQYGEEVFATVSALNAARWRRFSTLLRGSFEAARPYFGPGEVDLLHIDGLHTYAAVAADFRSWRETVSDRGVVLFHDTNVRERQFGVWRLWQELRAQYPHCEFVHGHGLGVLGLGPNPPAPVAALFEAAADPGHAAALRGLFAARGEAVRLRHAVGAGGARLAAADTRVATLTTEAITLRQDAEAATAAAEALRQALAGVRREAERQTGEITARGAEARALRDRTEALREEAAALRTAELTAAAAAEALRQDRATLQAETRALAEEARGLRALGPELHRLRAEQAAASAREATLRAEAEALRRHRDAMAASTSWRVTLPLRVVGRLARGDRSDIARARRRLFGRAAASSAQGAGRAERAALPEARMAAVDIIICVHNAPADVRRCLDSVLARTLPPFRLILVDDGSGPETASLLREFARDHGARLIRHAGATGYTRAANAGLRASDAPWVVLLNSDTIVTDGWLDRMVQAAASDRRIGMVGPISNTASWQSVPQLREAEDWAENPFPAGVDADGLARILAEAAGREPVPMPFLNGFCLLIRRELIEAIGVFDEARFGAGYGEENDYCIRARAAGWRLAVADDAYVFHAQSRSYSHDRRRALAERADRALLEKHDGATWVFPQIAACRDNLAMAGLRARVAAGLERRQVAAVARQRHEGRRIAFILPVASEGGGANVVLQEAAALAWMGVDAALINLSVNREGFEASYPSPGLPVHWADSPAEVRQIAADPALGFDAVVATAFSSFAWLPASGPICGYYIQDYEPWFFPPDDPRRAEAEATYRLRPEVRRFTKSRWNARHLEATGGLPAVVIGPSVDAALFRPAPGTLPEGFGGPLRITAMVRPATPRRQPALTAAVLQAIRGRCGAGVALSAFGAEPAELAAAGLDMRGIDCLGRLDRAGMAALLRRNEVFLDLSDYQAMGLTALEAMASGCAVLVPQQGGATEYAEAGAAALVADTADPAAAIAAALRLVEDATLRTGLRRRAVEATPGLAPEFAAARLLEALFGEAIPHAAPMATPMAVNDRTPHAAVASAA